MYIGYKYGIDMLFGSSVVINFSIRRWHCLSSWTEVIMVHVETIYTILIVISSRYFVI